MRLTLTLTKEERRQKLDQCLRSVEFLASELKAYDWTALGTDGTLSYVTLECTHLLKHLRSKSVSGQMADVPRWTLDALLRYANATLEGTSRDAFLSSFEKNFGVRVVSVDSIPRPERRLKPIRHYRGVKR